MKAIILAAGVGKRLLPLTSSTHKSLMLLDGKETIMDRMLRQLISNNITDITVVIGYEHQQFKNIKEKYANVKFVFCPFYNITNNIVSLWMVRDKLQGDVIIWYGDVLISNDLLKSAIDIKNVATVLVDTSNKSEADYKVDVDNGKVIAMSKDLDRFEGEYVGITRLNPEGSAILNHHIQIMIENGKLDQWYENALVELIYTLPNFELRIFDVSGKKWSETDTINDLVRAKKLFSEG